MRFAQAPDIFRHQKISPTVPAQYVQEYNQLGPLPVALAVIPLNTGRIPANLVLVQCALTNPGAVAFGGQNLSFGSGLQLTAGQAAVFAVDASQKMIGQAVTSGVAAGIEVLQSYGSAAFLRPADFEVVILLNRLFAVGNLAGPQFFSVTYTQLVKI